MVSLFKRFRRSESGVTLIEGLITFPIMILVIVSFVEFGYAVTQWSQSARAVAIGARLAAVSDPMAPDFASLATGITGTAGNPILSTALTVSCTGASPTGTLSTCNSAAFNRILYGTDGVCSSTIGTSTPGMCDINRRIGPANVIVSYTRNGLGYVGRVDGPVVTVTVELRDMNFQFFLVGKIIGLSRVAIPATPVSVTGEDLASCAIPNRTATSFSAPC